MSVLNAEQASELLGNASSFLIHSGNVASWSKLRRKGVLTSTDELVSIIGASFTSWLGRQGDPEETEVVVRNAGLYKPVDKEEASNNIFSLKIFLYHWDPQILRDAIYTTLKELGLSQVQTVTIAFPTPPLPSEFRLDQIVPIWKEAELLFKEGVAKEVGVADLGKAMLEDLYMQPIALKPKIDQVNIAHCCTIPEDLQIFSKEHGITLNTHNDDLPILSQELLTSTLSTALKGQPIDHTHWTCSWAARYSSVIKLRGIISHKGYLLKVQTD